MAIVKHIKSRNANYSAAINYLLFEHDEKTGKKIVDESGRTQMLAGLSKTHVCKPVILISCQLTKIGLR